MLQDARREVALLELQKQNAIIEFLQKDKRARQIMSDIDRATNALNDKLAEVFAVHRCDREKWALDVTKARFERR